MELGLTLTLLLERPGIAPAIAQLLLGDDLDGAERPVGFALGQLDLAERAGPEQA